MKGVIKDSFGLYDDAVAHYGVEGCVVVVDVEEGTELPEEGESIVLVAEGNWAFGSVARDVRRLSKTALGFFVPRLRTEDAAIGSLVVWGDPSVARVNELIKQTV